MISKQEEITSFSLDIEKIVSDKQVSYMDAIFIYCENTGMEIETTARLVTGAIRAKVKKEAEDLNFLPRSNTIKLPI